MKPLLERLVTGQSLSEQEAGRLLEALTEPDVPAAVAGACLAALRCRGETAEEVRGFARALRALARRPALPNVGPTLDIVGTGGDGSHTFNISTCSMFVAAAAGAKTAKHGGRSVSSKSGSADVLESLGVNIHLTPEQIARSIEQTGIGFMFAPNHHPAMKNVAPVRKELGVRTMFNILGPLTNPASAPNILMGVFHPDLVGIQVRALERLGAEHALVVYGQDGLDEVSLGAATLVGELKNGKITEYEIHPEDFGFAMSSNRALRVETPEQSRAMLQGVLDNQEGPARDIVVFNSAVALYAANVVDSIEAGLAPARAVIANGAAKAKLQQLVARSQQAAKA